MNGKKICLHSSHTHFSVSDFMKNPIKQKSNKTQNTHQSNYRYNACMRRKKYSTYNQSRTYDSHKIKCRLNHISIFHRSIMTELFFVVQNSSNIWREFFKTHLKRSDILNCCKWIKKNNCLMFISMLKENFIFPRSQSLRQLKCCLKLLMEFLLKNKNFELVKHTF